MKSTSSLTEIISKFAKSSAKYLLNYQTAILMYPIDDLNICKGPIRMQFQIPSALQDCMDVLLFLNWNFIGNFNNTFEDIIEFNFGMLHSIHVLNSYHYTKGRNFNMWLHNFKKRCIVYCIKVWKIAKTKHAYSTGWGA